MTFKLQQHGKFLMVMLVICIAFAFIADPAWANNQQQNQNTDAPTAVTDSLETMSKSIFKILIVGIPITYFLGVVVASVVFAFKAFAKAKNDQIDNPGKAAAMTGLITALVGFGGGGVLFLAADRWIFGQKFFTTFSTLIGNLTATTPKQ